MFAVYNLKRVLQQVSVKPGTSEVEVEMYVQVDSENYDDVDGDKALPKQENVVGHSERLRNHWGLIGLHNFNANWAESFFNLVINDSLLDADSSDSLSETSLLLYFYYSLSYELTDILSEINGANLLALLRVATLWHDEFGQISDGLISDGFSTESLPTDFRRESYQQISDAFFQSVFPTNF
ncbi:proteasome component (PCI) domain-containing protein [Artemisia annua]|uniref:Proteasome component (PCI) domain-containing protein n=1 Tax=Artemisia annua TaxID=35608 RepID=A0A2U1LM24_ARTAN|nr:proteasome component (PCI) domain-containing protein [Artemisia annua]